MSPTPLNPNPPGGGGSFEATLHLVTHAPVPQGIEDRVNAALRGAPRHSRVLAWPSSARMGGRRTAGPMSGWMRVSAAAAIVVIVAGGGWGVYSRVQHEPGKVSVAPAVRQGPSAGFSSAGAMRTPQTVQGPVLVQTDKAKVKPKTVKKQVKPAAVHPGAAAQTAAH